MAGWRGGCPSLLPLHRPRGRAADRGPGRGRLRRSPVCRSAWSGGSSHRCRRSSSGPGACSGAAARETRRPSRPTAGSWCSRSPPASSPRSSSTCAPGRAGSVRCSGWPSAACSARVVAWRFGALLGPGPIEATAAGLPAGSRFDGPLTVSAYGVLLAWPMAAVITYFAVAAGAESSEPRAAAAAGHESSAEPPARATAPTRRTRRRPRRLRRPRRPVSARPTERSRPGPADPHQVGGGKAHLQPAASR